MPQGESSLFIISWRNNTYLLKISCEGFSWWPYNNNTSEQGFCFLTAGTIDEKLIYAAQKGSWQCAMVFLILVSCPHRIQVTTQTEYARSMMHIWPMQHFTPYLLNLDWVGALPLWQDLQWYKSDPTSCWSSRLAQKKPVAWASDIDRKTKGYLQPGLRWVGWTRNVVRYDSCLVHTVEDFWDEVIFSVRIRRCSGQAYRCR